MWALASNGAEAVWCEINCNGAYVTSWRPEGGEEVLFCPKRANWGEEEVHGGIPICWPWFGKPPREGLPKHGLARYSKWRLKEKVGTNGMRWILESTPETMRLWPHKFRLDYTVKTSGLSLMLELKATNTDDTPFEATGGFHPYFKVADSLRIAVNGKRVTECYRVTEPSDGHSRMLEDLVTGRRLTLSAIGNGDWMAWNPGRGRTPLCVTLGPDEWKGFFCLEPYSAKSYRLNPGQMNVLSMTVVLDDKSEKEGRPLKWKSEKIY